MDNIYAGTSDVAEFVRCIDNLLVNSDQYIRYDDVYKSRKIKKVSAAADTIAYKNFQNRKNKLTRAMGQIVDYLQSHNLSMDFKNGKNAADGFRYPVENRDPLALLRENQETLCKQQLIDFIQKSAYFLPSEWLSYFMNGTQLLIEHNEQAQKGSEFIQTESSRMCKNKNLLPTLFNAIINKHPLSLDYWAAFEEEQTMIFHPHFLKEYNGRWFVFGFAQYSDGTNRQECCLALDRIKEPVVEAHPKITFVEKRIPSYSHFFDDIIGVTHLPNEPLQNVSIRTLDQYTHFRIMTKPLHISQKEIKTFDEKDGYGEWQITVRWNRELEGLLLSFGIHIKANYSYHHEI